MNKETMNLKAIILLLGFLAYLTFRTTAAAASSPDVQCNGTACGSIVLAAQGTSTQQIKILSGGTWTCNTFQIAGLTPVNTAGVPYSVFVPIGSPSEVLTLKWSVTDAVATRPTSEAIPAPVPFEMCCGITNDSGGKLPGFTYPNPGDGHPTSAILGSLPRRPTTTFVLGTTPCAGYPALGSSPVVIPNVNRTSPSLPAPAITIPSTAAPIVTAGNLNYLNSVLGDCVNGGGVTTASNCAAGGEGGGDGGGDGGGGEE